MKIEKIVKQKSGKYKLIFDEGNSLLTYDDIVLNYNLLFHKEIDMDTYHQIENDTVYFQLLNNAIKYLSRRFRSKWEIRKYLEKKTKDSYLVDTIVNDLIDDYRFAKAYINDKLQFSNCGILKIKRELSYLGVDEEIVEDVCNNLQFNMNNDKLKKIIAKKIATNHKYSASYLKQKILNDLINMGFERKEILDILDSYNFDDSSNKEKEYLRLYHKLERKYQGKELESQINRLLKVKGFK